MHITSKKTVLGFTIKADSVERVLEHIKKYIASPTEFFHIISLNPENIVLGYEDEKFREIVLSAQITIPDGIGVVQAARYLGIPVNTRVTGVDLMSRLVEMANEYSLPVMLIGAQDNLAQKLAKCYSRIYGQIKIVGLEGIKNIDSPTRAEEERILAIVTDMRPCFIFVAFGSPVQEKWLWDHREAFKGCICMGVGGGFDLLFGRLQRAPSWIRSLGFEWFYQVYKFISEFGININNIDRFGKEKIRWS